MKKEIIATITNVQVEASLWGSGWVVIAQWIDPHTQRTAIFRSRRQSLRPSRQIGESVAIEVDLSNLTRYHMEI